MLKSTQTEKEWSNYWFENVILKHADLEYFAHPEYIEILWERITGNPNTTIEIIERYIHLPWHWEIVCYSLIKSIDFVLKNYQSIPIDWNALSCNKSISLEDIENNLHLPWNFGNISSREDMTLEFVKRHSDKDWDILALSEQANLWEDIDKNAQNYCIVSAIHNPKLTLEFIERHMSIYTQEGNQWCLNKIFSMRLVTIDFIERHLDYLVSVGKSRCISYNPHVTIGFIRLHPEVEWSMNEISENNPSITPEIVMANLDLFA